MNRPAATKGFAHAALGFALAALALVAPASSSGAPGPVPPSTRWRTQLTRADTLVIHSRPAYRAYIDSLTTASRSSGSADLEMVAALHHAASIAFGGAFDAAKTEASQWLPRARATHDTLLVCMALRTLGFVELIRQHYPEASVWYGEMQRLAVRARLDPMEGYARIGTGYLALQAGRFREAERSYRRATRLLERAGHRVANRTARAGLANTLMHEGRTDEARQEYEGVLAAARAEGDLRNEADVTNDLGVLENEYGDPSLAAARYRESCALQRKLGRPASALVSLNNVALCYREMENRETEAAALFDSTAAEAASLGARDALANALSNIASIRRRQGNLAEAERISRRLLAMKDSINTNIRGAALAGLVRTLVASGRAAEGALEVERDLDAKYDRFDRSMLFGVLGEARFAAGQPDSAIAALREANAILGGSRGVLAAAVVGNERQIGDVFRSTGHRDSALAHYRIAAAGWERTRAQPSDLAWRESYGYLAATLYGSYAVALLDPTRGGTPATRAAEAFAALQPFRARSFEDALRGAAARPNVPRVTLAGLRSALRSDELFLDLYAAPDTTILFAVTRATTRAVGLPAESRLAPRLRRFADLLAAPEGDREQVNAAAAALGSDLFGPIADLLAHAHTVLLAAGRIGQYPLGMLRLPGERGPLAATRQWGVVPSATLLASSRGMARANGAGVLALCRTTDASGGRLEGVARESRWLARAYPKTEVRENDGGRALDEMIGRLGRREVLHIASHARGSTAAPWRAGFLLGRGRGEDAWLTASRISTLRDPARVCVLAGCSSAGAAPGAEAIPNLAAAWLASGASAVIASLWPVGDEATARLVEQFYGALFRGRTTGQALAEAQRAVSAHGATPPRDWAGFVLVGDPETRVAAAVPPHAAAARPLPASRAR